MDTTDRKPIYTGPYVARMIIYSLKNKWRKESITSLELIISSLLEMKAIDVNRQDSDGSTPLMHAVLGKSCGWVVQSLKRSDTYVNIKNNDGNTALALVAATADDRQGILRWLLEKNGIDVNLKNSEGETALVLATKYGCDKNVQLLKEHGGVE
ncbi:ankyrin repeat-containing domain protein [Pyronema domesticum]|nr:ankyrin repeat-containing domain protein [Pyronema domesticum]